MSFSDDPRGARLVDPGRPSSREGCRGGLDDLGALEVPRLRSVPDAVASTGPPPEPSPTNAHPYTSSSGCPPRTSTRAIALLSPRRGRAPGAGLRATRHRHAVPSADPVARIVAGMPRHAHDLVEGRGTRRATPRPRARPIARASRRATRERSRPPRRWRTASRPRDKTRRRTRELIKCARRGASS